MYEGVQTSNIKKRKQEVCITRLTRTVSTCRNKQYLPTVSMKRASSLPVWIDIKPAAFQILIFPQEISVSWWMSEARAVAQTQTAVLRPSPGAQADCALPPQRATFNF